MFNLKKSWHIYIFVSLTYLLLSCSDDNVLSPTPEGDGCIYGSVIGEWIDDSMAKNKDLKAIVTSKFLKDGSSHYWTAMLGYGVNLYSSYEGSYQFENGAFSETYVGPFGGAPIRYDYAVSYLDNYTWTMEGEDGEISTLYRVADSFDLIVGEKKTFITSDENFHPTFFESLDPGVAEINSVTGEITALRRGMTFVKGKTSYGTLAIRVNVTNSDNYIDDFVTWMDKPIKDATKAFGGGVYVDVPGDPPLTVRSFSAMDPLIETIDLSYFMQKVCMVNVKLRDCADVDKLIEYFDGRYSLQNAVGNVLRTYKTEYEGKIYYIYYQVDAGMIMYIPYVEPTPDPDDGKEFRDQDFRSLENLLRGTIQDAASMYSHVITEEEWEDGFLDLIPENNEVFDRVTLFFDAENNPCTVDQLSLYLKKGVKQEAVEEWYKKHYISTDDSLNPYTNEDGTIFIRFKKSGSMTYVQYKKTKFRR